MTAADALALALVTVGAVVWAVDLVVRRSRDRRERVAARRRDGLLRPGTWRQ